MATLPADALLAAYVRGNAYTDCYSVLLDRPVSLAEYMEAFYTTFVFRTERRILARFAHRPSTDQEARELALGKIDRFAAWRLEARETDQAMLAAGRTRSWLMVSPFTSESGTGTTLYFGSAVLPDSRGRPGWQYRALLGFHRIYSRVLLGATARRLAARKT